MPKEHGDSRTFVKTVSLKDILGVSDMAGGPVALSVGIVDKLDCSRETARRKLQTLYKRGDLERQKVSRQAVYWETDVATGTMGYNETVGDTPQDVGDSVESTRASTVSSAAKSIIGIDAVFSDIEVSGFRERVETRKAAVRAVLKYLIDRREAKSETPRETAWEADSKAYTNARGLRSSTVVRALHQTPEVSSADKRQGR